MTLALRHTKGAGFTLLPVILAMSLIAAIAFLLNRDNGVNARMIANRSDLDRARYAAEAGLQAVNFVIQSQSPGMGCTGTNYPTSGTVTNFFGATYSAYASKNKLTGNPPPPIGLVSTGSYNGASVTLTRDAYVYQSPMTIIVRPGDSLQPAGYDTYLDGGSSDRNFGGALVMKLSTTPSNLQPLLKFDLAAFPPGSPSFPPGSRAIPWYGVDPPSTPAKLQPGAKLSLFMSSPGSAGSSGSVNAQLITQNWVAGTGTGGSGADGATWDTYDGYVTPPPAHTWSSPRYAPVPVASIPYTDVVGWYDWDLTNAAAAWMSGVYTNYGIWLVGSPAAGYNIGNTDYVSSNSTATDTLGESARPKLTLNTLLPCGAPVPPSASGTPATNTTITLITTKDTFICCSTNNFNEGGYSAIGVWNGGGSSNISRSLVQFDLTSIPTTNSATGAPTQIVSATMKLYSFDNNTQTGLAKTVTAYRVTQPWDEGTKSGSGPANGATWNYAQFVKANNYIFWTNPGGTYDATSGVTGTDDSGNPLPTNFAIGWVKWDVTPLVQNWFANMQDWGQGYVNNG
ncbi:MAG TPA: DNRLRE domain-containing protein, partial [Burkholderiales bacterium]|nr:DNRLRE domain-containing protein [Burkholderiales bacterium]